MYARMSVLLLCTTMCAGNVAAACSFGRSSEPTLQSVFDTDLGRGALNAADCIADDRTWSVPANLDATIVVELAGFAAQNEFGIYSAAAPAQRIELFGGPDGAGAGSTVRFSAVAGGYRISMNGRDEGQLNGDRLGFYLSTPTGDVFYSDPSLNGDRFDHLYAYRGTGGDFVSGPLAGTNFATSMYLLAFEDLTAKKADRDYQDFVALVNLGAPVPLPASGWLLGAALIALLASYRKRAPVFEPSWG